MARIIVADDNRILRMRYKKTLEYLGHEYELCVNGKEALDQFIKAPSDLMILDFDMPEMNGLEACESIRRLPKGIMVPIIMVSSHDEEDYILNCMNAGANDYMVKPVSETHLIAKLKNFLKISSLNKKELELVQQKAVIAGRYQINKILGYGSHSVVYLAKDNQNQDSLVAIKILNDSVSDSKMLQAFIATASKIKEFDIEQVLKIHDFGQASGHIYLVMEYAEGGDLTRLAKKGPLDQVNAVKAAIDVLKGLEEFHKNDLLHLDLKPENIMMDGGKYKLGDFGIMAVRETATMPLNAEIYSSVAYSPPEFFDDTGELDGRSDIYSLGVTLYELVTLDNPFMASKPAQAMFRQMNTVPTPASDVNKDIHHVFSNLLSRMMLKDRELRPNSKELLDILVEMDEHPEEYIPVIKDVTVIKKNGPKNNVKAIPSVKRSRNSIKKINKISNISISLPTFGKLQITVLCTAIALIIISTAYVLHAFFYNPLNHFEIEDFRSCNIKQEASVDLIQFSGAELKEIERVEEEEDDEV